MASTSGQVEYWIQNRKQDTCASSLKVQLLLISHILDSLVDRLFPFITDKYMQECGTSRLYLQNDDTYASKIGLLH